MLISALQEFRDLGVDFISHTQAIDTTTPMGRLFFHVIGSFGPVRARRDRPTGEGGSCQRARPEGTRLGRPVRDPGAASRVCALRADGMSLRKIAAVEGTSASGVRKMLLRAEAQPEPTSGVDPDGE